MHQMTSRECYDFVARGTRTGKLAIVRRSLVPHVTPVWFLVNDAPNTPEVIFTLWGESVKARALRRCPDFSLCVDDQTAPYSYVQLNGVVRLESDPEELLTWATRLGGRYMGKDLAAAYGKRNSMPGELLARGRIDHVVGYTAIAE